MKNKTLKNAGIKKDNIIQEALIMKKEATNDRTQLSFDSETGELIIKRIEDSLPSDIVVDQIYKDGFFNNN